MQSQALARNLINISEVTTDMATNSGGNENLFLSQFINFTWDPSIASLQTEAKRREDLIRHDKFISSAIARGVSAKAFHVVFPIPQVEIDANKAVKQNDGY